MQEKFKENEIPYNLLEKIGLSKNDILSLDKSRLEALLTGNRTELVQIKGTDLKGDTFDFKGKLSLYRKEDNSIGMKIHPIRPNITNDIDLTEKEVLKLQKGELITKSINGERHLIQLDKDTNELLRAKTKNIFIPSHIKDVELSSQQKEKMRQGLPIIIESGKEKLQVGLDLNSPRGLKLTNEAFDQKQKISYDRTNPQIIGTIKTDRNISEFLNYNKKNEHKIKI